MNTLVALCAVGAERILGNEIKHLGYKLNGNAPGRVSFFGDDDALFKANLCLRTADRVYLQLAEYDAFDFQDTDITIKGILAQKQVYKNNKEEDGVRFTVWTPASDITISGARKNTMNIPSQRGQTGLDYSRNIR